MFFRIVFSVLSKRVVLRPGHVRFRSLRWLQRFAFVLPAFGLLQLALGFRSRAY